jgi:hypothetical protein
VKVAVNCVVTDFGNVEILPRTFRTFERLSRGPRTKKPNRKSVKRAEERLFKIASAISEYCFAMNIDPPGAL